MLIDIDCDFDTWIYVAVAVELRILELEKIKPTVMTTATDKLCLDQLVGLRKFSAEIKRKFRYEKPNSDESVQQGS